MLSSKTQIRGGTLFSECLMNSSNRRDRLLHKASLTLVMVGAGWQGAPRGSQKLLRNSGL